MNKLLKKLFDEDQATRLSSDFNDPSKIDEGIAADKVRKEQVQEMLNNSEVKTAEDYYHASLVFQHGETTEDFKKANDLAKKSMDMGDPRAKQMYENSYDRMLMSQGKLQKYGTQF